jgi:alcohol dehydrogenase class IV
VRAFGEAVGGDPAARVEELTALGGITRLRDLGVPEHDLAELGAAAAQRGGNQANPHPATPKEIEQLLRSVW